jgi:hypothetical protein
MARITGSNATESAKDQNRPVHLVSVHFDALTTYTTDAFHEVSFGGNTYNPAGGLLQISDVTEQAKIVVSKVQVSLSGVDQTNLSLVLAEDYIDRPLKIYLGFLDDAGEWVADPILVLDGRMDAPTIKEDINSGKSVVSISATNAWVDFNRNTGRHTNHEQHQTYFPGDKGFEFASEIQKDIPWGRE